MAAKRTSRKSAAGSKSRKDAKQALAGMVKAHKSLQLNLKKLQTALGHTFMGKGHTFIDKGHTFTS